MEHEFQSGGKKGDNKWEHQKLAKKLNLEVIEKK